MLSISSGIVEGHWTNCYRAKELLLENIQQITGNKFGNVSLKRKDKIVTFGINDHLKVSWFIGSSGTETTPSRKF